MTWLAGRAKARADTRANVFGRDLDLSRGRANTLDLARAPTLFDLDPATHGERAVVAGGARSMPDRVSRGLVTPAVWVLPVSHRSRYRAEFRVELVELPRRERLGYSLRVRASAWELRRALVEAECTPDGATARRVAER